MKAPTSKTITNANLRSFLCEEHYMIWYDMKWYDMILTKRGWSQSKWSSSIIWIQLRISSVADSGSMSWSLSLPFHYHETKITQTLEPYYGSSIIWWEQKYHMIRYDDDTITLEPYNGFEPFPGSCARWTWQETGGWARRWCQWDLEVNITL